MNSIGRFGLNIREDMNLSRHKQEHLSLMKLSKVDFGMDMLTLENS